MGNVKNETNHIKKQSTLKTNLKNLDTSIIGMVIFLLGTGFAIIYSITSVLLYNNIYDDPTHFIIRQALGCVLGIVGILIILSIPFKLLKSLSFLAFFVNVGLLALTLVIGTGPNGSVKSWIDLGPLKLQPAELVKIGLILAIAWFISTQRPYFRHLSFKEMIQLIRKPIILSDKIKRYLVSPWGMLGYTALILLLIMMQPDLGTGLVILGTGVIMILCSGVQFKTLGQLVLVLVTMFSLVWVGKDFILKGHQLDRFLIWENPFIDEQGLGYQNIAGYTAIALGGMKGSGLGEGIQKYGYVVEPHNDFIISIVAEELGIFYVLGMMLVYFLITLRIISRAYHTKDMFASLVCIGVGSSFILQVIINLGGVSGTIPMTGVTLPFVSYGGTSIMTSFFLLGVYFNVNSYIKEESKARRRKERELRYEEEQSRLSKINIYS